jgi:hypothetical protein
MSLLNDCLEVELSCFEQFQLTTQNQSVFETLSLNQVDDGSQSDQSSLQSGKGAAATIQLHQGISGLIHIGVSARDKTFDHKHIAVQNHQVSVGVTNILN